MIELTAFQHRYGPWALVTGASDGIGRACAVEAAARGLNVLLVARRESQLVELAAQLVATHGVNAEPFAADLATEAGLAALRERAASLDVGLFVAAAGFGTSGAFTEGSLEEEQQMVAVNCGAVLALAHDLTVAMRRRGRGALVLLSSIVAFQGVPRAAAYSATKAFIQSLAEGLRAELSPDGVEVLAVAPGPVRSGFAARADMVLGGTETPSTVARGAFAALGGAFGTVRPGWLSKLLGWSLMLLPRALRVRLMGAIMGGMTAHQRRLAAGHTGDRAS